MIENNKCLICGGDTKNNRIVYKSQHISFVQCQDCQLYYQPKYLTTDELKEFYKEDYCYNVGKGRKSIDYPNINGKFTEGFYKNRQNKNNRKRLKNVIGHFKPNSNILEIGADAGGASIYFRKLGHNVELTEIGQENCDNLRKEGFTVYQDFFETITFKKKYDIIVALEVLEHFSDPIFCVNKIYELLNDGGMFIFETPVAEDGLKNTTDYGFQFAHCCIFNNTSLKRLFNRFSEIPEKFEHGNDIYIVKK